MNEFVLAKLFDFIFTFILDSLVDENSLDDILALSPDLLGNSELIYAYPPELPPCLEKEKQLKINWI